MRAVVCTVFALSLCSVSIAGADERRQLGPHEHGKGTLTFAVEGKKIALELEAPGMDIVGFEHAAKSDADKKKVADAKKTLSDPLKLFVIPEAAGCKVVSAKAALKDGHDDHDKHGKKEKHGKHDKKKADKHGHDDKAGDGHSEFHANYQLECAKIESVTGITFKYFDVFAGAKELNVNVATTKGQTQSNVSRDKPQLSLGGLM